MPRTQKGPLTALQVQKLKAPGYHRDQRGLFLQISKSGTKSWIFRYMLKGVTVVKNPDPNKPQNLGKPTSREMGLGSVLTVSLAEARDKAQEYRKLVLEGKDPKTERDAARDRERLGTTDSKSFKQFAADFIAANAPSWKNAKHAAQWENTLATYAFPIIGDMPPRQIETRHILQILQPIIHTKRETANRVRGRVEQVLNWSMKAEEREAPNPARWRGHLELMLPKDKKRKRVRHHPALPFDRIGTFIAELRQQNGSAARALEYLILTVGRTSEVILAEPGEIDPRQSTWLVPAGRMKGEVEHRVPLSAPAVRLVKDADGPYIFPGQKFGKPLSNMAMLQLLERMGYGDYTVHGFRSTFRDWAAERTEFPREVAEMALSHVVDDETEAAYRRGDLFEKRRRLMEAWAKFCDRPSQRGKVVSIRQHSR